jgi:hypothetical protein
MQPISAVEAWGQVPILLTMRLKIVQFCALFFLAVTLGASLAHLFELPNKIHLNDRDYLTVQQIYRGWAVLGFAFVAALVFTIMQAILVRTQPSALGWTLVALGCMCASQVLFWTLTYPANRATANWTTLPAQTASLRARWEYSHAAGAGLNLIAHAGLVLSLLVGRTR